MQDANVLGDPIDSTPMSTQKPTSKALKVLAANLDLLIGEGKRYPNNKALGALPRHDPLGEKMVYRIRKLDTEPGINTLERIADATGIPIALLLIPGMEIHHLTSEAGIRRQIATLIEELVQKDAVRPLTPEEIEFVAGAIKLVKRSIALGDTQTKPNVR